MGKSGRTYVNQSVSFPPSLLKDARERAKGLRLSFSRYVQYCIERDLKTREGLVLEEQHREPATAGRKKS